MAHIEKDIEAGTGSQESFAEFVKEKFRQAVRTALIRILEEEVTAIIEAEPYQLPKRALEDDPHQQCP
jgi:hypothetical protein